MNFNVVRHLGEPKSAETLKGTRITRQEELFVPEWGQFVKCTPYDNHFIYENPDRSAGTPAYVCTCGSAAVISYQTKMFVCLFDATYGKHQTSLLNRKDFKETAGQTIEVAGKRARVK